MIRCGMTPVCAFVLFIWGLASAFTTVAGPPEGYSFAGYDEAARAAQAQQKRLMVYFGREGCGWCEKTNKEAFSDAQVRRDYHDHYVLAYVDTESGKRLTLASGERLTEMELAARLRVFATPVFVWLEPDGRQILKISGIQTPKDFRDYDRFVHGEVYRRKPFSEFVSELK